MSAPRHRSREFALQFLYSLDHVGPSTPSSDASTPLLPILDGALDLTQISHDRQVWHKRIDDLASRFGLEDRCRPFAEELIWGVLQERPRIDDALASQSKHWRMERMNSIDKQILRIALYELLFVKVNPAPVIMNEAIQMAKDFGSEHSSKFVNGILDALAKKQ